MRLIKPPMEGVTSGRVFRPANLFLFKKMLKAALLIIFIWFALFLLFIGFENPILLEILLALSQPLEILVMIGFEPINQYYTICAIIVFVAGSIYTYIYISRIEYSVVGWSGDVMPEIYTRKGIINITKKHVPFRTIVNVRTTRGIIDRIFGIGSVLIETAGGTLGTPPTGLLSLLISRFGSSAFEEKIEGIRFNEELRDFILREMRHFESNYGKEGKSKSRLHKKRIFSRGTLEIFKEIRDTLKDTIEK